MGVRRRKQHPRQQAHLRTADTGSTPHRRRAPASTSARRTHWRSVSAGHDPAWPRSTGLPRNSLGYSRAVPAPARPHAGGTLRSTPTRVHAATTCTSNWTSQHPRRDASADDPATAGITWALSIVGLVIVIRILLIPSLFQQIKASRGVQRQAGYLPRPGIQCCGEAASPPNAATNRAHDRRLDGLIRPSRTPACPGPRADDRRGYR